MRAEQNVKPFVPATGKSSTAPAGSAATAESTPSSSGQRTAVTGAHNTAVAVHSASVAQTASTAQVAQSASAAQAPAQNVRAPEGAAQPQRTYTEVAHCDAKLGGREVRFTVCQSSRGRFLNIEADQAYVIVPGASMRQLLDGAVAMRNAYAEYAKLTAYPNYRPALHTERFQCPGKRFYMDLYAGERGYFVRFCRVTSQGKRISFDFPAASWEYFCKALADLMRAVAIQGVPAQNSAPVSGGRLTRGRRDHNNVRPVQRHVLQITRNRELAFETGTNRQGPYLRVRDSNGTRTTTITLPASATTELVKTLMEVERGLGSREGVGTEERPVAENAAPAPANSAEQVH